jgi:carbon storage regulator
MLVLSRRIGEEILIANDIRVTIVEVKGGRVRLGITAPLSVRVERQELRGRSRADKGSRPVEISAVLEAVPILR